MAGGCRDCQTCTQVGVVRMAQDWTVGFGHLSTAGVSWAVKRGFWKHCPDCKHLLSRHQRRADGSFID